MAHWRIWFWSSIALIVICAVALFAAVWNNLQSEWDAETTTAQFALDHSPVTQLSGHDVFTAAGVQEVYWGTDTFHRDWYVFVTEDPMTAHAVQASTLIPQAKLLKMISDKQHWNIESAHLGYLNPQQQGQFHADSNVVYEVIGHTASNQSVYAYYDAITGKLAWQYVLST